MSRSIGFQIYQDGARVGDRVFSRNMIKIGRLASAHLRLTDPQVSRIHAVIDISSDGEQVSIVDMGSATGTKVNGQRVSRVRLKNADEITLGLSRLIVVLEPAEVEAMQSGGAAGGASRPKGDEPTLPPDANDAAMSAETEVVDSAMVSLDSMLADKAADDEDVFAESANSRPSLVDSNQPITADEGISDKTAENTLPDGIAADASERQPEPPAAPSAVQVPAPAVEIAAPALPSPAPGVDYGGASFPRGPRFAPLADDPVTPENRHLEITMRWGSSVLDVKRLRGVPSFTIGATAEADMFAPLENFQLVRQKANSAEWEIRLHPSMSGTVRWNEKSVPLRESGARPDGEDGATALTLSDDMRVEIAMEDISLEVRNVSRSRVIPIPPFFDMFFINSTMVTLFTFLSFLSVVVMWPTGLDDDDDMLLTNPGQFQTLILKPPPKDNSFLEKLKRKSAASRSPKKGEGKAGKKQKKKTPPARMATKAPKKEKPTDEQVVSAQLSKLFGADGNAGVAQIFGANVAGGELQNLLGGLSGAKTADAAGAAGLSFRGAGPGGASSGTLSMGSGRIGTRGRGSGEGSYGASEGGIGAKTERGPVFTQGTPVIYGSLDKEIIRRVVRENANQIRYCYERELTRSPGLYGKITMKWVISGEGKVTKAFVGETQMKNANVENCLARRIRGWNFPKPKGGGIVVVTYPFVFKKSG